MKDIKFRAWDNVRKEYLSAGCVIITVNSGKNPKNELYLDTIDKHPDMYKNRFVLEQSTGSKDDDSVEIYEGDILKCVDCMDEEYITVVTFGDGAFSIDVNGCDYDYTAIGWAIGHDINECHVIGNIHENPERLAS